MVALPLDHVGLLVEDLPAVGGALEAAGFLLTPPVHLRGADGVPTGGVQQTTVFERGYLEVQELVQLGLEHPLEPSWSNRPCVAVVAWTPSGGMDAAASALRGAGEAVIFPAVWSRPTPSGEARFGFARIGPPGEAPMRILTEHLTPQLTTATGARQPNGVDALIGVSDTGLTLRSVDPASTSALWTACGWPRVADGSGGPVHRAAVLGIDITLERE